MFAFIVVWRDSDSSLGAEIDAEHLLQGDWHFSNYWIASIEGKAAGDDRRNAAGFALFHLQEFLANFADRLSGHFQENLQFSDSRH